MRLGRVEFRVSYVVDLDNPDMITHAQDAVFDDVYHTFKYGGVAEHIMTAEALPTDTADDIPPFLLDDTEEEA
jgi:hypothetical protein